jgi:hypothetical protein
MTECRSARLGALVGVLALAPAACGGSGPPEGTAGYDAGTAGTAATGDGEHAGADASSSGGHAGSAADTPWPSDCNVAAPTRLASGAEHRSPLRSDGRFLYYLGVDTTGLRRVPVNGGAPEEVLASARSFALTPTATYYSTWGGEIGVIVSGGAATRLATGHIAEYLAVGRERLLWAEPNNAHTESRVYSLARSGGPVTLLSSRDSFIAQIEATPDAVFWVESIEPSSVALVRSEPDGTAPTVLVPQITGFVGFAVAGDLLAIATRTGVSVVSASGGDRRDVATDTGVRAVTLDGNAVYYAREDACVSHPDGGNGEPECAGKVFFVPVRGGDPQELFATEGAPDALAVDSSCVYVSHIIGQCHPMCAPGILDAAPLSL